MESFRVIDIVFFTSVITTLCIISLLMCIGSCVGVFDLLNRIDRGVSSGNSRLDSFILSHDFTVSAPKRST